MDILERLSNNIGWLERDGFGTTAHTVRDAHSEIAKLREKLAEVESEVNEQARLNGMGSAREAALMAKLEYQTKQGADRLVGLCKCGLERDELKAKLKELEGQEPFGYWHQGDTEEESDFYLVSKSGDVSCASCVKLFAKPIPPVDVQKLLNAITYVIGIAERGTGRSLRDDDTAESFVLGYVAELERKLAEQQAYNIKLVDFISNAPVSSGVCCCGDSIEAHTFGSGHSPVDMWDHAVFGMIEKRDAAPNIELNTLLAQAREEGRKEAMPEFKIPAYRLNDFCEQVFNQSVDVYDLRLFDYGRLVEAECRVMLSAAPTPGEKE